MRSPPPPLPPQVLQHSFMEIVPEIFSAVILSLPLLQEGHLSVSGDRMCTNTIPGKVYLGKVIGST